MTTVLYAEDDPNDIALVEVAMQQSARAVDLHFVKDGAQAMAYLQREGRFSNPGVSPIPNLVFLDVKMPRVSGLEVLAWIRQRPAFANIPVVIVSSSAHENDILRAYALGANAYLIKPSAFARLQDLFTRASDFFLRPIGRAQPGAATGPGRIVIH